MRKKAFGILLLAPLLCACVENPSSVSSSLSSSSSAGGESLSSSIAETYEDVPFRVAPQVSEDGRSADIYSYSVEDGALVRTYEITLEKGESYVDFQEVALYYLAFGEAPANYFWEKRLAQAYGSEGRYMQSFQLGDYDGPNPYTEALGTFNKSKGTYLELDIDVDGSYRPQGNRGVGRLVIVVDGIEDYGADPVVYQTEDHYDSFSEFYNYPGGWSDPFDGTGYGLGPREAVPTYR